MNFPEVKEETRYSRCVQGKEVEKLTHQNVQGLLPRRNKAVRNGEAENASPEAAGEGASQGSTEHENRSIKRGQARGRRGLGREGFLPPFKYINLSKETDFTFNLPSKRLL